MNILHLGKYYPPYHGGMEHYLKDLAEAQVKNGHQVFVLIHNHQHNKLYAPTLKEQVNGVDIIRQTSTRPVMFTPLMTQLNRTIKAIHRAHQIDVIHLHWPNPSSLALLLKDHGIPVLMQWHSDIVTESSSVALKALYWLLSPFENRLMKRSAVIQCSSPNYISHSPALQKHREKCHVVALGINSQNAVSDSESDVWAKNLWPQGQLKLFHLGRMTHYKNQSMLIKLAETSDQHHTVLAGDGALLKTLKQQAKKTGLKKRITFTGRISQRHVHALFKSCDVFCLPSHDRAESFGVVLLEAMRHNKIILVADTPGSGMSWLAQNYKKGFVFKNKDIHDMKAQLGHISAHIDEINARPHEFNFPIQTSAEGLDVLYQKAIQSNKETS